MNEKDKNVCRGLFAGIMLTYFCTGHPVLGSVTLLTWGVIERNIKKLEEQKQKEINAMITELWQAAKAEYNRNLH